MGKSDQKIYIVKGRPATSLALDNGIKSIILKPRAAGLSNIYFLLQNIVKKRQKSAKYALFRHYKKIFARKLDKNKTPMIK